MNGNGEYKKVEETNSYRIRVAERSRSRDTAEITYVLELVVRFHNVSMLLLAVRCKRRNTNTSGLKHGKN